ncbi:hypothetical protein BDW74DRAFT_181859 [Aspergillus multicolor]|uniref:uncharacterized protein n=1 Tax=Aspergillus multicolor TaxID=41759 RepID=UPI003CCD428A
MSTASLMEVMFKTYPSFDAFITDYGLKGYDKMLQIVQNVLMPWTPEEYLALYEETVRLIDEVDPAVIVVDSMQRPFVDAARNANRQFAMLNPNALTDIIAYRQPWGQMFWKYPAMMSGHTFPVSLKDILPNIWMQIRFIWTILKSPKMEAARTFLKAHGIKDPINMQMQWENVPLLSGDLPEAGLPLSYYPPNVTVCGPIVLGTSLAEQQDPELAQWLDRAPSTMLICLGSNIEYNERRARALGSAILHVLETIDTQVIWKFVKEGEYDDTWREPLQKYIDDGRLRMESWLNVDPVSLVNTGKINVWVHHGGANCYYEAAM